MTALHPDSTTPEPTNRPRERRSGQVGFVEAQELGQDLSPDADGDVQRGGDLVDDAAQGVPYVGQFHAVAARTGWSRTVADRARSARNSLGTPRWSAARYQTSMTSGPGPRG
jgi:hypothetical protein